MNQLIKYKIILKDYACNNRISKSMKQTIGTTGRDRQLLTVSREKNH